MSQRMTNILGYLTLFAILGAIWVLFGEDPSLNQGARGEKTFGDLQDTINQVTEIRLSQQDTSTTLKRDNGLWLISEREGYRAQGDKVRDFLRGIALSERREPKTASNDRFDQIGLGDATLNIKVYGAEEKLLAEFKMGSRRENSASGRSLTYIYKGGDTRSWLVSGLAAANADPSWWLESDLFLIDAQRALEFKTDTLTFNKDLDTNSYSLAKDIGNEQVELLASPEDAVAFLSDVKFTDIKKQNAIPDTPFKNGYLKTYDGLTLEYTLYNIEDTVWLQLNANFDPDARDAGEEGILEGSPENGAQEAEDINARTNGWVFALSKEDAAMLLRSKDDYIENTSAITEK